MNVLACIAFWGVVLLFCRYCKLSQVATIGVIVSLSCILWLSAIEMEKGRGFRQCESSISSAVCDSRHSDVLHGL
jgi:hypothetical protein